MQTNKVVIPAATKVAIGFVAFLLSPLLLVVFFDPIGLVELVAYLASGLVAMILVYLVLIRISMTVTRRLAFRADLWFARRRTTQRNHVENYCVLLRSTQADVALSIDASDGRGIRDADALRLDVAPSFRSLLAYRMQPLYTILIKNSEHFHDVVSVTYTDAEWRYHIIEDMKSAKLVLLLPLWPTEALAWEMQELQRGEHLGKTFIVMPPAYLFRPGTHGQPTFFDRLNDRLKYMIRETLEAMAPDYFVDTRHSVSLEAERIEYAKAGWESAKTVASHIGLQLPEYDSRGAILLASALIPPAADATPLALDSHRIAVSTGTLDWKSDTTGPLLLSVARGR